MRTISPGEIVSLNRHIYRVSASSTLVEGELRHEAERAIDGKLNTAWVEGAEGEGYGETIQLDLNGSYIIAGFKFNAGYQLDDKRYYWNGRPEEFVVSFSDGSTERILLEDINGEQYVFLEEPVESDYVEFSTLSVYPGNKCEDTCISEIVILGAE